MYKNGMVSTTYILFESFGDDCIGTQIFLSNHDVKFYDSFISQVFFFFGNVKIVFSGRYIYTFCPFIGPKRFWTSPIYFGLVHIVLD